jgi:hypothetical protein
MDKQDNLVTQREMELFIEESRLSRQELLDTVRALTGAMNEVRGDFTELNTEFKTFKDSTKDLVITFESLKGLVTVLIWIGKALKPLAVVGAAIVAAVLYFQGNKAA